MFEFFLEDGDLLEAVELESYIKRQLEDLPNDIEDRDHPSIVDKDKELKQPHTLLTKDENDYVNHQIKLKEKQK